MDASPVRNSANVDSKLAEPQVIEICCGSAGLCAAFCRLGIPALGIDWGMNRHVQKSPWLSINMAEPNGLAQAIGILEGCTKLNLVWIGAPCGTASRAREVVTGPDMPQQLRSAKHPDGLPGLSGTDAKKVQAANVIYSNSIKIIEWCEARNVRWCVENPANSYLWYLPEYANLLNNKKVKDILYSACMMGGKRNKKQRLRTNSPGSLAPLDGLHCDGRHAHEPWSSGRKQWHTADEAEYPEKFCEVVAKCFSIRATVLQPSKSKVEHAQGALAAAKRPRTKPNATHKGAVGDQPRSTQAARLVPEYRSILDLDLAGDEVETIQMLQASNKGWTSKAVQLRAGCIPPGARILKNMGDDTGECAQRKVHAGLPWTPDEFIAQAACARHPFDDPPQVADRHKYAIFVNLTRGPQAIRELRRQALEYWRRRADELQCEEEVLFRQASPLVQPCWGNAPSPQEALSGPWKGKRTLLFQEMAAAAGVAGAKLITAYMQEGAPVFGEVPASGLYESHYSGPDKSVEQVLQAAKWSKPSMKAKAKGEANPSVDAEVLERTEAEVKAGKASGPYTEEEVDAILGKQWAPARRVGLVQSSGIRPIDDFSEYGHNGTSETHEKVDLATVDVCVGILKQYYTAVKGDERVSVEMYDGEVLEGPLHPSLKDPEKRRIHGRTVDLRQAFKQLAPAPAMAALTVVGIWHPVAAAIRFYLLRALPFGARNAVFVFGATARALECILICLFFVVTAQYVDDFPQFEAEDLVGEADDIMCDVLKLLGWEVKMPENVPPKFDQVFTLLGVRMHLGHHHEGAVLVTNKKERAEKICADVERMISAGRATPTEIEAMRGSLNFAKAQCFGRCGAASLCFMSEAVRCGPVHLDLMAIEHLRFWPKYFANAKPRTVRYVDDRPPAVIFTDGAEEGAVGVGGILMDAASAGHEYFGGIVDDQIVQGWLAAGNKQRVIHQAEVYPALIALGIWAEQLRGRRVIFFVDNDAAKECLIKGTTRSKASAKLVADFWCRAAEYELYIWVERVASAANPADAPSRRACPELERKGIARRCASEFGVRPYV